MSHPYQEHRAHKVERHRVHDIAGVHEEVRGHHQRARGGKVHDDEREDKALIKKSVKKSCMRADGGSVKARADKAPRRAKGGKVHHGKGHSKTNVNVIVAPSGKGQPPMMPPAAGGLPPTAAAPPMPPKPPMAPPVPPTGGQGAMGAPGMGGMPMRKRGGRTTNKGDEVRMMKGEHIESKPALPAEGVKHQAKARKMGGKVHDDFGAADMNPAKYGTEGDLWGDSKMHGYAKGGKVEGKKSGADMRGLTGIGARTPIQHSGNKSDGQNIGRKAVITKATGGPIYADGRENHDMGPNLNAGANSGLGRIRKIEIAEKSHWKS